MAVSKQLTHREFSWFLLRLLQKSTVVLFPLGPSVIKHYHFVPLGHSTIKHGAFVPLGSSAIKHCGFVPFGPSSIKTCCFVPIGPIGSLTGRNNRRQVVLWRVVIRSKCRQDSWKQGRPDPGTSVKAARVKPESSDQDFWGPLTPGKLKLEIVIA